MLSNSYSSTKLKLLLFMFIILDYIYNIFYNLFISNYYNILNNNIESL